MKSKVGLCFIIAGVLLVIAAAGLVVFNASEDKKSGEAAQNVLNELKRQIVPLEAQVTEVYDDIYLFDEYDIVDELPIVEIEGEPYIGYISIPSIGIELPVMDSWSYENLKISPCRYSGEVLSNDIVIAAHNYSSHFGKIEDLNSGDEISLTAVDGRIFRYEVVNSEIVNGRDVSAMEPDDSWDLTIFTCTLSGQSRVTVRAVKSE